MPGGLQSVQAAAFARNLRPTSSVCAKRSAVQMRSHTCPVRALLRENVFHQVGQNSRRNSGDQNMIARRALAAGLPRQYSHQMAAAAQRTCSSAPQARVSAVSSVAGVVLRAIMRALLNLPSDGAPCGLYIDLPVAGGSGNSVSSDTDYQPTGHVSGTVLRRSSFEGVGQLCDVGRAVIIPPKGAPANRLG
jgi:hypothetical protein